MTGGRLKTDALYMGLTRPPMVAGVTYSYFTLNGMLSLVAFVNTKNPAILIVVGPVIHLIGYYMCMREPRMLELITLKFSRCAKCKNRNIRHFGNNSYDMY